MMFGTFDQALICIGSILVILFLAASALASSARRRRNDPMYSGPAKPRESKTIIESQYIVPYSSAGQTIVEHVVDTVPDWLKDERSRKEWHKQDVLEANARVFSELRGCVTDAYVRRSIQEIQEMPANERYDAFDVLYTQVVNGHAYGYASRLLDEVSAAWNEDQDRR